MMKITEKQRQQIKNILCEMAMEAMMLQNKMEAVDDISRKVMQEADTKSRHIVSIIEENKEPKDTCHVPQNPNESQMERDDSFFKKGYEQGMKEWAENSPKEYEHGYEKGLQDAAKKFFCDDVLLKMPEGLDPISGEYFKKRTFTQKEVIYFQDKAYTNGFNDGQKQGQESIKIVSEDAFNTGFEKGMQSLEKGFEFRRQVISRLEELKKLLVI